jgi:hypothetical protein
MHLQKKNALPGYRMQKKSLTSKATELGFLHARREASKKWLTSIIGGNTVQLDSSPWQLAKEQTVGDVTPKCNAH